jgi:hypothetical protein
MSIRRTAALLALATLPAAALAGCGTSQPGPISAAELASARTFPYYTIYWAGPTFEHHPVTAADGVQAYKASTGDSIYYGGCVSGNGPLGSNGCLLPLKVRTTVYVLHSNVELGTQRNTVIRGVPAAVFDEGRAIELYTGQLMIDVYSNTAARTLAAANLLRPLNATGTSSTPLPPPAYCPELAGHRSAAVFATMQHLPGQPCQSTKIALAQREALKR